jgi:hypothetical protein
MQVDARSEHAQKLPRQLQSSKQKEANCSRGPSIENLASICEFVTVSLLSYNQSVAREFLWCGKTESG